MTAANEIQKFVEKEDSERQAMAAVERVAARLLEDVECGGKDYQIESEEEYDAATELLFDVKERLKDIKKRSKTVTQPLYQALEAFRDLYRPTVRSYEKAEGLLKRWTTEYVQRKKRQEEEATRQIAEAAKEGNFEQAMQVSDKLERAPVTRGISYSEEWTYELEDLEKLVRWALDNDRLGMVMVNDGAMVSYVKSFGKNKPKDVPGMKFFRKMRATVTPSRR